MTTTPRRGLILEDLGWLPYRNGKQRIILLVSKPNTLF